MNFHLYMRRFPVDVGGLGENLYYKLVTADLGLLREQVALYRGARLHLPPKGQHAITHSKTKPHVRVPGALFEELKKARICTISENYSIVVEWIAKKEYFRAFSGVGMTEKAEKWFDGNIRAKLRILVRAGDWIDESGDPRMEFLLQYLRENFDLGRRSRLTFTPEPSEEAINHYLRGDKTELAREVQPETTLEVTPDDLEVPTGSLSFKDFLAKQV